MGNAPSSEVLALRWAEVCNDPILRELPYKIELNAFGTIEMSPASTRHSRLQAEIAHQLRLQLPLGAVFTELPVLTRIGIRVPDVAWASESFVSRHGDLTPLPAAPEICVEVQSPSNPMRELLMKADAFVAAGATEVWIVTEDGEWTVHTGAGLVEATQFPVKLALPPRQNQ
jgi:Uma2 family endonuclease